MAPSPTSQSEISPTSQSEAHLISGREIVACYVVCNEADHIAESIRSVKAYVDRFVIIDSVFSSNDLRHPLTGEPLTHSIDNTRGIAEQVCAAEPAKPLTYITSGAKLTEAYARNAYLEQVRPMNWALIIDGDEILYGDYARILAHFDDIRSGKISHDLSICVYTVAVNVNKEAPDITEEEYNLRPLISTRGYMPRLVEVKSDLRYTTPEIGYSTPILTFMGLGRRSDVHLLPIHYAPPGDLFLINNHVRQSLESYKNDYIWETRP